MLCFPLKKKKKKKVYLEFVMKNEQESTKIGEKP